MLRSPRQRRAATAVEFAFVSPVLMLFVIGLIVAGLGIFRYQEAAWLAREGARFASVRGTTYQSVTGRAAASADDVNQHVRSKAAALDPNQLNITTTWNPDNREKSLVTVTVKYQWVPEAFLGGIQLSSTSTMMVSY